MLLITFGTRPEWIKIKPILDKIENKFPYRLVCTGQHQNLFDDNLKNYQIQFLSIEDGKNRLDAIVTSILKQCDDIFENITYTLVQGDTTSAFAIALGSFHRKIPVIHLEAGLRSWDIDNPYPEEFNRLAISSLTSVHLCPTTQNKLNVNKNHGKKYVVGNTVLDALVDIEPCLENLVLVTLHRRENLNDIKQWFESIENLAQENAHLKFIFPMHPNPQVQQYKDIFQAVNVVEPLSHNECVDIIAKSCLIITDSGGIQEESSFLKKKCIVCRKTTERTEGEGIFSSLCPSPKYLKDIFYSTKIYLVEQPCPYGDGRASEKIIRILECLT